MDTDPSGFPDPRETREVKLLADIPRLANEVIGLAENLEPPLAEESVYTFSAKGRILRIPEHLQNFVTLNEQSPKLVAVEVRYSSAEALDYSEMMVSFELSNGQIVRASRDGSSSIDQVFAVSLKQDGHDYTEAEDMSYAPFPAPEIARLVTGLIYDRNERASFPDGYLSRIDLQEYGTSMLLKAALENKCDSFRMRKAVRYDDTLGHQIVVAESYDSLEESRMIEIETTSTSVDVVDGSPTLTVDVQSVEFDSATELQFPLEIRRHKRTGSFAEGADEPQLETSLDPATVSDLNLVNRYLHRMKVELEKRQPEVVGYDNIDEN